jgi:hypothetical protein
MRNKQEKECNFIGHIKKVTTEEIKTQSLDMPFKPLQSEEVLEYARERIPYYASATVWNQ